MESVQSRTNSLLQSLLIDAIGMATYLLPGLGESFDLMVAPILAIWIWRLHGSWVAGSIGFFEEVLPFTDIFPTATATWCYRYLSSEPKVESPVLEVPRLGSEDAGGSLP